MSLPMAITIAAFLVASYSAVGGLLADAVTDVLQGFAVISGLIVLSIAVAYASGGVSNVLAQVEPEKLRVIATDEAPLQRVEQIAVAFFGSFVAIELISRFLGARSAAVAA